MSEQLSYSWRAQDGGRIRITVEPSMTHANVCTFVVDPAPLPEAGAHFKRGDDTDQAPLATRLFGLDGINELLIANNTVTVTTDAPPSWDDYSATVAASIRAQIDSAEPPVLPAYLAGVPTPAEMRDKVQIVIDESINPAVAAHGGVITLLDVQGNNIYLEFGGGCQGCGMVSVTLKYGVERLLREQVPQLGQILDTTDHAAGQNPYYAPAAK